MITVIRFFIIIDYCIPKATCQIPYAPSLPFDKAHPRPLTNQLQPKVRRDYPMEKPQYYDPCDYPRPSDAEEFAQVCGATYLGSSIFCDPDHQFSRTEADALGGDLVRLNISSCLCGYPTTLLAGEFEQCSEFRGAVLFARDASVAYKRATFIDWQNLRNYGDDICQKLAWSSEPLHERTKIQQMTQFAEDIARVWRDDSRCQLDLLLVVVSQWYPNTEPETARIVVFVSWSLQRRLRNLDGRISPDQSLWPTFAYPVGRRPTEIFAGLKAITSSLTKGTMHGSTTNQNAPSIIQPMVDPDGSPFQSVSAGISMPDWAIILFIVCILMLPLCVLIGNFVSVVPSRRMNQATPDQTSMRWANKRWRAGFGGGFFGIRWKAQTTTAGDPATVALQTRPKPQSNNMMFRQFSKFKKPLKQTPSPQVQDGRMASWTYV